MLVRPSITTVLCELYIGPRFNQARWKVRCIARPESLKFASREATDVSLFSITAMPQHNLFICSPGEQFDWCYHPSWNRNRDHIDQSVWAYRSPYHYYVHLAPFPFVILIRCVISIIPLSPPSLSNTRSR